MKRKEILPLLEIIRNIHSVLHTLGGLTGQGQLCQALQQIVTDLTKQVNYHGKSAVADHLYGGLHLLSNARECLNGENVTVHQLEAARCWLAAAIDTLKRTDAESHVTFLQLKVGTLTSEQVGRIIQVEGNLLQECVGKKGTLDLELVAGASISQLTALSYEIDATAC